MRRFVPFRTIESTTLGILGVYVCLTAILVFPEVATPGLGRAIAISHLGLTILIAVFLSAPGRRWTALGVWLPLLALPVLYAELPIVIAALGSAFRDAVVQRWELSLFGGQPSRSLAGAMPSQPVSEVLHAAYLAYYPMIYGAPLGMYLWGARRGAREVILAITLAFVACFATYAFFPVQGPRFEWGAPAGVPAGFFRALAVRILRAGSSRGAAFPSSHVALSVALSLSVARWHPRVGAGLMVATALLAIGAVYGGFHYGVDAVAGAIVGVAAWLAVRWIVPSGRPDNSPIGRGVRG